jgi:uncharacterized protein (DUF58 family)
MGRRIPTASEAPASGAISADLLRQVRRIEMRTRRLVDSLFSGEYHSVFKGQGIEFAEVREYLPGDDVRSIDWKVTARLGHPFIKRYVEERELTVVLAVDLSGSQRWGSRGRLKSELVAEVAATLAMSAVRNRDRVGLLIFTDRIETWVPPRKGRRHVLRLIRDLLVFEPEGSETDASTAIDHLARALPSHAIVFIFSDFQIADWERFERSCRGAAFRHDLVAVTIADPGDDVLPDVGFVDLIDPETGRRAVIDSGNAAVRERFATLAADQRDRRSRLFRRLAVDEIELRTEAPYASALLGFFRRRERRAARR